MHPKEEEFARKFEVRLSPHRPERADEVLDALAEYLVSIWLRRQERQEQQEGSALPGD